jgi:hypothetical protein
VSFSRRPGLALWVLLVACAATFSAPGRAATWSVKPGGLAQALRQAADGDILELQAGHYHGEVGTIAQKKLTLRGVGGGADDGAGGRAGGSVGGGAGGKAVLHADGKSAEDKAILVVRDGDVNIENIEFRGARVRDRNGAGIRFEKGRLRLVRCAFFDNENGVLTANVGDAELNIEDSVFGLAPVGTPLPHLIYVGKIARFTLTGSRVFGGQSGHLVKSRARINMIRYNHLVDGVGGRAAYELEFPNGGLAYVVGNVIGQSAHSSNPALVSFGAEAGRTPDDREQGLFMAHNTLISEGLWPGLFVRIHDMTAPVARRFVNNLTVGVGVAELGLADTSQGNFSLPRALLQAADAGLFALSENSWLKGRGVEPGTAQGESLAPVAEFKWPVGTQAVKTTGHWSPGAYQN